MTRQAPRRPARVTAPARVLSLAEDLSVLDRLETAMRVAAADRPRNRQAPAMARLADWLAGLR